MKYAFMSFSTPELTLDEMLATAAKYGYDGIEPRLFANHAHGVEVTLTAAERKEVKEKAANSGVALACIATSCRYADPESSAENVEVTKECIDLAGDLGAPTIRVFGGKLGEGLSREDATELLAGSLASVADLAAQRDVLVCVETHDAWTNPPHLAAVMEQVNHPNIVINWDIMHPVRVSGVTMDDAFAVVKPWIRHVHFHDGARDGTIGLSPIGEGIIDHRSAAKLLMSIPYEVYLSGEWINWEPHQTHLPRELATMKSYESGPS